LAVAKTTDEVKDIRDRAEAMRAYARQAKNRQLEVDAAEIRIRAERRLGELITAQKETVGLNKGANGSIVTGSVREPVKDIRPTLADAGIGKKLSSRVQKMAAVPEAQFEGLLAEWRSRVEQETERVTIKLVQEGERRRRGEAERQAVETADHSQFDIRTSAVAELDWIDDASVDLIVTDPPYPREFLTVYSELSKAAARVLKPGASCFVMIGQSYLPEVAARLCQHLTYNWCLSYLTPGPATKSWDRRVMTFWKPILWMVNGHHRGRWIGDVRKSEDNDKRFHHWGQSESGMADLIRAVSEPGDLICDPFLGGGTTAVVALDLGRRFVGSDVDPACVRQTLARLSGESA
jgi:DNA modification methylase